MEQMKILLVEDEAKLANAIKRACRLRGWTVTVTHDGEEGLDLAAGEKFDLVILDLMLPKIDGLEICRRVRAEKLAVPILMLTAKGRIADKVAGLDAGADDYLVKPFSFEELFARVRALTRRPSQITGEELTAADLKLNTRDFHVSRKGQPIKLSAKEFAILKYLLRQKERVVSKDQILEAVWDYNAEVLPGTVEVHIKHLRDKIDRPFGKQLIQTVRGFGYKLTSNV